MKKITYLFALLCIVFLFTQCEPEQDLEHSLIYWDVSVSKDLLRFCDIKITYGEENNKITDTLKRSSDTTRWYSKKLICGSHSVKNDIKLECIPRDTYTLNEDSSYYMYMYLYRNFRLVNTEHDESYYRSRYLSVGGYGKYTQQKLEEEVFYKTFFDTIVFENGEMIQ
ncbi:MAG: hypothetical protein IJ180_06510 [Bacteroidales bacterium]|nr:hypothetical protein [Bacteroidales bacterium]